MERKKIKSNQIWLTVYNVNNTTQIAVDSAEDSRPNMCAAYLSWAWLHKAQGLAELSLKGQRKECLNAFQA